MAQVGRPPTVLKDFMELMKGRFGYDAGLTSNEIAAALFNEENLKTQHRARQVVHRARKHYLKQDLVLASAEHNGEFRYFLVEKAHEAHDWAHYRLHGITGWVNNYYKEGPAVAIPLTDAQKNELINRCFDIARLLTLNPHQPQQLQP